MDPREESILAAADIAREAEAMSRATLDRDFDEARFRASLIVDKAAAAGLDRVACAAARALERLGPVGARPHSNYGEAVLRVASAMDALWFDQH